MSQMDSRLEALLRDAIKRTRDDIDELAKGREPKKVRAELGSGKKPTEGGAAVASGASDGSGAGAASAGAAAAAGEGDSVVEEVLVILPLLPVGAKIPPSAETEGDDDDGDDD
jgi:hypothetical protein